MTKRYFDDVEVGDRARSIGRTVSESDVYTFSGLAGYYGEIHTNKEYMKNSEYGRRLVHGPLLVTILTGLTNYLEDDEDDWDLETIALYGFDNVRFLNPVFIDDTVHLEWEITDKELKDDEQGIVTLAAELYRQDGTLAMRLDWLALLATEGRGSAAG